MRRRAPHYHDPWRFNVRQCSMIRLSGGRRQVAGGARGVAPQILRPPPPPPPPIMNLLVLLASTEQQRRQQQQRLYS